MAGQIAQQFKEFIASDHFPCIASKAALAKNQLYILEVQSMHCPADDKRILDFLYSFVDGYKKHDSLYQSAVIIFTSNDIFSEDMFEAALWKRLQSLSDLDAKLYPYDPRVTKAPDSDNFSFSIKEEAFFIIGLHTHNSRPARRFPYPTLVFNPHDQFERLRSMNKFDRMKETIRKKDLKINGSVNPMLDDYGTSSEAYQYSGKQYDKSWQCPLHINHKNENNTSKERNSI